MSRLVALILLVLLFPLWAIISVVQWFIFNKVLFTQIRIGIHDKPFVLYKFQTICENGQIARWGRLLRHTSLDEIPQLVNIVKGDMNFIGPRPLLPEYLPLYNQNQLQRHLVKPGITGWAQVQGRNTLSWKQQFDLDLYYVNNQSLKLDLYILLFTFKLLLLPSKGELRMRHPFDGNN